MDNLEALASLADNDKDLNDSGPAADFAPEVETIDRQPGSAAMGSAAVVVQVLRMIQAGKWPHIEYQPEEWAELQRCLAAVLEESGGGLPEWLVPYQTHLRLIMCLGGMAFSGMMQDMAHQQAVIDAENGGQGGAESEHSPT